MKSVAHVVVAAFLVAAGASGANAQMLSQKPIVHFVVPLPPGGGDILARTIATPLATVMNRTMVIENNPGADGAVAAEYVRRASPDGTTVFFATNSPLAAVPALRKQPPYDPIADFTPISQIGVAGFFLYVNAALPVKSVKELIEYGRANPEKLKFGVSNSSSLFALAQLLKSSGIKVVQANYAGDGNAIPPLASGEIDALFATVSSARSLVESGKLRVLATTLKKRSSAFPDAPTLDEQGVAGITVSPWVALFGPAKMPRPVVDEYAAALKTVLDMPDVKQRLTGFAIEVESSTPEQMAVILKENVEVTRKTVLESNLAQE